MALVDNTDVSSLFMNPGAYSQVKGDGKSEKGRALRRKGVNPFSRILNDFRAKTAEELGPVSNLPVCEKTAVLLMDEVHSAGSALRDKPCPNEILRYKKAVRCFMHYVVTNSFSVENETGLPRYMKPGFTGRRGSDEALQKQPYTKIQIIDKKLEDFAAGILAGQFSQLKIIAGLDEINGLLVDLLQ